MTFLKELANHRTLRKAWRSVARKRGVPGIDRVSLADFRQHLDRNIAQLRESIQSGEYRTSPVLRIRPSFLEAADRALVVPTVRDRLVHRAISDLLSPKIDPTLASACRAFRKNSSAMTAADDVGRWIEAGTPWVLRADVRKFFDSIQRDVLWTLLEPFVDPEGLTFLDRVLRCQVLDRSQVSEMVDGIAQGSPLSPLLGNLYLSEVDHALVRLYPETIRYCDDLIVLAKSEEQVQAARQLLEEKLTPLGLELNQEKSRVCRAEDGFVFLGYHFDAVGRGPAVKAVEALRFRLAQLAQEGEPDLRALDAVYQGWTRYFGPRPELWLEAPIGALAWLRSVSSTVSVEDFETHRELRWRQPLGASPSQALHLARAWAEVDRLDQAWLELAMGGGGSRASGLDHEAWSRLLEVEPEPLADLAARLTGSPEERLTTLVDGIAQLGGYDIATRLAADSHGLRKAMEAPRADSATEKIEPTTADVETLLDWFQGREGTHAEETIHLSGHRRFVPLHRPLDEDDWRAHLRGDRTLGLPLIRSGNNALVGVLDVDVTRRALEEGKATELMGRALATALRLRRELERRGASSLLEFSGHKGYHVWIRLEEPAICYQLRRWLLDVVEAVSPLPEGIRVEEFPNRDRIRSDKVGPLVKLPLGIHAKTGRRCALLDDRGDPVGDPFALIASLPRVALSQVPATAPGQEAPDAEELGPRVRKILRGCRVLDHLARRARDTSYLVHRERLTLLCVLGHLGDEGGEALHAIIRHTYNYRREATDRHIARLPEWPISCPKVRELHPQSVADKPCSCKFNLRGRGYPTPLLHALRPSDIAVFEKPKSRKVPKKAPSAMSSSKVAAAHQGQSTPEIKPEALVEKLIELKRHRRGIQKSIAQLEQELSAIFESLGSDRLDLGLGTLRRVEGREPGLWDFLIEL